MPDDQGACYDWYARNPVSPRALRLADIVPGRRVLGVISIHGIVEDLTIVTAPYPKNHEHLKLDFRYTGDRFTKEYLAHDAGLAPKVCGEWSRFYFLVCYEARAQAVARGIPFWDWVQIAPPVPSNIGPLCVP
jgi:hypothetical protein